MTPDQELSAEQVLAAIDEIINDPRSKGRAGALRANRLQHVQRILADWRSSRENNNDFAAPSGQ